jgi:hypothetical protein
MDRIAESPAVTLRSLGTTLGHREVLVLEIGTGKREEKPAVLVVGSVEPGHLLGGELSLRLARRLAEGAAGDKAVRKMLERVTFYVIPRPSPDAVEAMFRRPLVETAVNERPVDDDGDGRLDEDGPEDLNGDGLITVLRVEDAAGRYIAHPADDRVLVKADAKKHERGRWSVYVEGRDRDHDEQIGEDPPGGVAFNRNFPFEYPYYEAGAGPHQVSEIETRAVADFAFDHPNIAVVFTLTPEDNLMRPWKASEEASSENIKTSPPEADAAYFHLLAEEYQKLHGDRFKNTPEPPEGRGSFSEWAYYHYGRWSLAARGWWIPEVAADVDDESRDSDEPKEAGEKKPGSKPDGADDKRGGDDLNALRWFAREKIDGFVPWTPIEHLDFPGRKVELGGFKPLVRLNPPPGELEPLAETHWQFLRRLVAMLPRLALERAEAEPLGGGVWRVTAVAVNRGSLPTMPEMGRTTRVPQPVQIELVLPDGVRLVTGYARRRLDPLAGDGGRSEQTWLVTVPEGRAAPLRVRVWSPSVGSAARVVKLGK